MYEDEPLKDYYTLMDIAYIYTWRRVRERLFSLSLLWSCSIFYSVLPLFCLFLDLNLRLERFQTMEEVSMFHFVYEQLESCVFSTHGNVYGFMLSSYVCPFRLTL